jgi:hypothetical protein
VYRYFFISTSAVSKGLKEVTTFSTFSWVRFLTFNLEVDDPITSLWIERRTLPTQISTMARVGPSQPSSPSPTTENPVVAVGRKLKADLRKHQRPTIRIYRDSSSNDKLAASPRGTAQQIHTGQHGDSATQPAAHSLPSNNNSFSNRIRSLFGSSEASTNDEPHSHEYDHDMVDLLDVVGMYG